jgi:DtxR family transcriptional regulator, Mn-dependent transcriptional regulator
MEPSPLREDILEALFKVQTSGSKKPVPEDIASMLGHSPAEIHAQLRELEQEGALIFDPDGSLILTPSGKDRGGRVMRKHRILECFFSEMLGMSPDIASEEACTLEHGVSDDTIERLGRYLQSPGLRRNQGGLHKRKRWKGSTLLESSEGDELVVSCIRCDGPDARLMDLGILPGERIRLIRHIPDNGVVIRVKGCDIALSNEIASSILIERMS